MLSPFAEAPVDADVTAVPGREKPATHPGTAMERKRLLASIAKLAADGRSADEIGKLLGESPRRVTRLARQKKIVLAGRGGRRHLTVGIGGQDLSLVNILAKEAQVTRAEMIVRLALAALKEGTAGARVLLGKDAKPKRRYRPRASKVVGAG